MSSFATRAATFYGRLVRLTMQTDLSSVADDRKQVKDTGCVTNCRLLQARAGWVVGGRKATCWEHCPPLTPPKSRKCQVLFQEELTRTHEQEERRVDGWEGKCRQMADRGIRKSRLAACTPD